MPPCQGLRPVATTGVLEATMVGVMVTFPDPSIATEELMFMSKSKAIGEVPRVLKELNGTVAVNGPATV